jgi:tetratricopeptide (TPR) repeat protein
MRLPVHTPSVKFSRVSKRGFFCLSLLLLLVPLANSQGLSSYPSSARAVHNRMHDSEQWAEIEKHLPDPKTASPHMLEQQADILRARRFPDDALDYYKYAVDRGGNAVALMNKMGLTELEMKNTELARAYFQRVVKMDRKNAEAWNNLGAVEFIDGQAGTAAGNYKRAIKIKKNEAVFHANLANAYFGTKNYKGARRELATALKLDPQVFEHKLGLGGIEAHVLSSKERARQSFEMAKLYAESGDQEKMIHALAVASEAGLDVLHEMHRDPVLAKFEMDPRVLLLVQNAQAIRAKDSAALDKTGRQPLPSSFR